MIIIGIEEKEFEVYETFKDVKVKDFIRITEWTKKNIPEKLNDYMFPKENETAEDYTERVADIKISKKDEKVFNKFKVDYIHECTGLEIELIKKLMMESDGDYWSLADLFSHLCFLLFMPETEEGLEVLEVNGNEYHLQKNLLQTMNQEIRLKGLTFIEHIELTAMKEGFKPFLHGSYEYLDLFLAVMYRPKVKDGWFKKKIEPYNEDTCVARRKVFQEVDMHTAFGACFFLLDSLDTYKKRMLQSFKKIRTQSDLKDLAE